MFTEDQKSLGLLLYDIGAFKDKRQSPDGHGFKLKLHEKNPEAPLSPMYLNLRTPDNPKPGPLTPEIIKSIAWELIRLGICEQFQGDYVVGVPRAGDPIAKAISETQVFGRNAIALLRLEKEESDGRRSIARLIGSDYEPGKIAIVVDDLVTHADSKLEAIGVLKANGLIVKDILVVLDRDQGGKEELAKAGYRLHSLFTIDEFLFIGRTCERLTAETFEEISLYLAQNR